MIYDWNSTWSAIDLNYVKAKIAMPAIPHHPVRACAEQISLLANIDPLETSYRFITPGMGLDLNEHNLAGITRPGNDVDLAAPIRNTRAHIAPNDAPSGIREKLRRNILAP